MSSRKEITFFGVSHTAPIVFQWLLFLSIFGVAFAIYMLPFFWELIYFGKWSFILLLFNLFTGATVIGWVSSLGIVLFTHGTLIL